MQEVGIKVKRLRILTLCGVVCRIVQLYLKSRCCRVKGLTAMFAEFDRPDWNGDSDKSIDFPEFEKGIMDLGLGLSSQQIRDVFDMVDKNGK